MHAEMPRAASLLHESSRVLSKAPNGRATDSGTDTPSGVCAESQRNHTIERPSGTAASILVLCISGAGGLMLEAALMGSQVMPILPQFSIIASASCYIMEDLGEAQD